MATLKEKEELLEAFKGPFLYKLTLWGYGGETAYIEVSKEAHDFWKAHGEEHGDSDVVHYMLEAEELDFENIKEHTEFDNLDPATIPREAMFMHDEEGNGCTWYESWTELDHTYGVTLDGGYLTVEQVDSTEWNAKVLKEVIENEELNDFCNRVGEESDYEHEAYQQEHEYGGVFPEKGKYICQFISSEKGTFYEAVFETPLPFDQNKLKLAVEEAPNGEDLVYSVYYDGEELDNNGGDTNGKGYWVYFYQQEH